MKNGFQLVANLCSSILCFSKNISLVCCCLLLIHNQCYSQTYAKWLGDIDTDWNNTDNWMSGVLPSFNSNVDIVAGTYSPVITATDVVVQSVYIGLGASLTVSSLGSLEINGVINPDEISRRGIYNDGVLVNNGNISISSDQDGIFNRATFTNSSGATLAINNTNSGIFNYDGLFTNEGEITIGNTNSVRSFGIYVHQGEIVNLFSGEIKVDNVTTNGIQVNSGSLINAGIIRVGSIEGSNMQYGIVLNSGEFLNNLGDVYIDRCENGFGNLGVDGRLINRGKFIVGSLANVATIIKQDYPSQNFVNDTDGILQGTGAIASTVFSNTGGSLNPGYSPGILTFSSSEDLSNSILNLEVNGTGVAGVNFDQIVVNGAVVVGGKLAVAINYTPAQGDEITLVSATSISGTFSEVTGLPTDWTVNYKTNAITVSYSNSGLPVNYTFFDARVVKEKFEREESGVELNWEVATEKNNHQFIIERSNDGQKWIELGKVLGRGTTNEPHRYSFYDPIPNNGLNYYRLKQMDFDGEIAFSKNVVVDLGNVDSDFVVWKDQAGFIHVKTQKIVQTIRILNTSGQVVRESSKSRFDVSDLPSGVWLFQLETNQRRFVKKVIL